MRQRLPEHLTKTTPGRTGIDPRDGIDPIGPNKTGPPQAGQTETGVQKVGGCNLRKGPGQLTDLRAATSAVTGQKRQPQGGLAEVKNGDVRPKK